jgi:tRNA threonylcarbamoyladenosine biosynthesis protein TsaE
MREYEINKGSFKNLYHIDLYRLEGGIVQEVRELGLLDIWEKQGNIVLIEWAEKIADIIPDSAYTINFEAIDQDKRRITINKTK